MELGALVERAAATGDPDLVRKAEHARRQLLDATSELREIARGVHPAVLTQDGLEAALANLADRSPVLVRLHVALDRRPPPEVEATAYFLVSEALTNAARHAQRERRRRRRVARRRSSHRRGERRRHRGRRPRVRQWPARARRPAVRAGRAARGRQPAGQRDHGQDGAGVRVILADDAVLLREGLARILTDSGFEVIGQAGDAPSLVDLVTPRHP